MFERAIQLATLLIPFYFFRFSIGVPTNIFEVVVVLAVIFLLAERLTAKQKLTGLPMIVWFFLGAATLSIVIHGLNDTALGIWKGWLVIPVVYFWLVRNISESNRAAALAKPFWLGLLIVFAWALLQKLGVLTTSFYQVGDASFEQYINTNRLFGPFESPNYLAMYLVPAGFVGAYFALRERLNLKAWVLLIAVMAVFVYWTGSKGGLLALGAAATIGLGVTYFPWRQAAASLACLVGLGAITTGIWQVVVGPDNLRREIYGYSWRLLQRYWPFGFGLGAFQDKVGELASDNSHFLEFGLRYALHAHNAYLQYILTMGALGLLSFLATVGSFFKELLRSRPLYLTLGAAMIAILVHGLFDTTYFKNDLAVLFWLILALSPAWQNVSGQPQVAAAVRP